MSGENGVCALLRELSERFILSIVNIMKYSVFATTGTTVVNIWHLDV